MKEETRMELSAKPNCEVFCFPERKMEEKRLKENRDKRLENLEKGKIRLIEAMAELVEVERLTGHEGLSTRIYLAFEGILADALHLAQADADMRKQNSKREC